uniref:Uncharacterized protein n=1 Tax=Meloidogyne enterolobii TaxID=390850 RepID=A0A6V7WRC0_MELEN|nr:unnamed protein product [Meloidogyne enterolobii]
MNFYRQRFFHVLAFRLCCCFFSNTWFVPDEYFQLDVCNLIVFLFLEFAQFQHFLRNILFKNNFHKNYKTFSEISLEIIFILKNLFGYFMMQNNRYLIVIF